MAGPAVNTVPPGRHPNWCNCRGCRNDIARFEAQQLKVTLILGAILVVITVIICAVKAIA